MQSGYAWVMDEKKYVSSGKAYIYWVVEWVIILNTPTHKIITSSSVDQVLCHHRLPLSIYGPINEGFVGRVAAIFIQAETTWLIEAEWRIYASVI